MKNSPLTIILAAMLAGFSVSLYSWDNQQSQNPAPFVKAPPQTVKQVFNALEVDLFENQKDSNFPADYLQPLQKQIVKQLADAKAFPEIVAAGETPKTTGARTLKLSGLITNYNPGNRAQRYFGMGGAGAAEIDSKVAFVDAASGKTLMWQDLRGLLAGGFFGGKSEDALKDFARQVVNKVKLMQNMRMPAPDEMPDPITADPIEGSSAPAQEKIPITSKDWPGSEQKINQKAGDGYRLVSLTITGMETAEALMVRKNAIADAFQYRLLHTMLAGNLGKDINKLAKEGYRVSPHTLVVMKTYPTVIVEKATPRFKMNYEYVLKETMLVSSGQKDVEEVQKQGYALIGETEHGTAHILLFEKAVEPQ